MLRGKGRRPFPYRDLPSGLQAALSGLLRPTR